MKRFALGVAYVLASISGIYGQTGDFAYKFYGRIKSDLFYNSRANVENIDGLFYLFPKDQDYDADGNDLNATPQGNMYMITTRLGVDVKGPSIGTAATSANIEVDFRGAGNTLALLRIRHAYVNLAWQHSSLLVGQTWHPLFGDVSPTMLNLSTGAPFQPFSRSPQIRYRYTMPVGIQLTGAAVWQQQYASVGPNGKSTEYLKDGCLPELYFGVDYKRTGWHIGAGAELLSLRPRKQSVVNGHTYKVNERVTSISTEVYAKYTRNSLSLAAKAVLANNLTQASMIGGYAPTDINPETGEMSYTPFRHFTSWVNAVYGRKWQVSIFAGYLHNLGTGKQIVDKHYGVGLDIDRMAATNLSLSYNLPHWKLGVELSPTTAWYGNIDNTDGKVRDTHSVTNYRVLAQMMYIF